MVDPRMNLYLEAGRALADPIRFAGIPPELLADSASRENLVRETENLITADGNAALGMLVPAMVALARADHLLTQAAARCLPGMSPEEATGVAMRFYAGFLDMAKSLREKKVDGSVIVDAERANCMAIIDAKANQDVVYEAGAKFGWWGVERPDRPQPEQVFDNGISDTHKKRYLGEFYQRKESAPN
jgi:hypothetical protein